VSSNAQWLATIALAGSYDGLSRVRKAVRTRLTHMINLMFEMIGATLECSEISHATIDHRLAELSDVSVVICAYTLDRWND
jgi:hypothetical protein